MSEITFAEIDPAEIEASVLTTYEGIAEVTLYPGDPVRLFLESLAYLIALQNNLINLAGRQNLLAYAEGQHLDEIGKMVGTSRLAKAYAKHTQRFRLREPLPFDVSVPGGTRVTTADNGMVFATQKTLVIKAGDLSADTVAMAVEDGEKGNGFLPGQISRLVDPLPYVSETINTTTSSGGADVETDARYRERIQLAPESFTCAGPEGAYRYHALRAHQDIAEAAIWTPKPGTVEVILVATGGELPSDEMLAAARDRLSASDVRPLTDTVTVRGPELVSYEIDVEWDLSRRDAALSASIQSAVADAVERYRVWQRSAAGRDINPTRLISLMQQAGARRVRVVQPEFTPLTGRQLARETKVVLRFMGIEDE